MSDELRKKANDLPQLPGVYMMKDDRGRVIYVGKAVRLKARVGSYFSGGHDVKTGVLVSKIEDFDTITVESEFEALVLENSLIKEHMPKYNIKLRDDKGYPYLRVDMRNEYPIFKLVSKPENDNALYLGPYGGRTDTHEVLAAVCKALKLPTCGKNIKRIIGKERPCLNHHMGACLAYCQSPELAGDYRKTIQAAIEIFQGKSKSLVKRLTKEMAEASAALSFETAALIRDRIKAIQQLEQRQIVSAEAIAERAAVYEEKVLKTQEWLKNALKLEKIPERIEAYDVSNTGASDIVASMTVFIKGKPYKNDYRRFKIKAEHGQDDYGSMTEVVSRRIERHKNGDEKFLKLPDIILVDGGANHASVVNRVLVEAGVPLPVFGMVKDDKHRTRALMSPTGDEIGLSSNPAVFALIGTIQEETHRFAAEYHRGERSKNSYRSKLDLIDGVGEKRRYALLKKFGSIKAIAAATEAELTETVPKDVAKKIYEYFHEE